MCDFLSGVINRKTCEIKFYDGRSHSTLFTALNLKHELWAEWEWVGEKKTELFVRTHDSIPGHSEKELLTSILSQFPKRENAVKKFVETFHPKIKTLDLRGATIKNNLKISKKTKVIQ